MDLCNCEDCRRESDPPSENSYGTGYALGFEHGAQQAGYEDGYEAGQAAARAEASAAQQVASISGVAVSLAQFNELVLGVEELAQEVAGDFVEIEQSLLGISAELDALKYRVEQIDGRSRAGSND